MPRTANGFLVAAVLGCVLAGAARAELTTGDLTGSVTVAGGGAVPGATVTVRSPSMMGSQSVASRQDGSFRVLLLPPGTYTVTVSVPALTTKVLSDVPVRLGATTDIGVVELQLPSVSEHVSVIAEARAIDTSSTTTGANISRQEFQRLPVGRAYQNIAALVPGVFLEQAELDPLRLKNTPSFLGSSAPENNYIVDGMTTTDPLFGLNGTQLTFDFIDEVQVLSGGYEAEYGRSTGGIINVITKSGSNDFHGSVYAFGNSYGMNGSGRWRSSRGEATNWVGTQYVDGGANLGGSLLRDKLWFFADYNPVSETSKATGFLGQDMTGRANTEQYAAKLTWNLTPAHHLVLSFFGDPNRYEGYDPQSVGNGAPSSYELVDRGGGRNGVLKYSGVLGEGRFVVDGALGRHDQILSIEPANGDWNAPHDIFYWSDPAGHGDSNPMHRNAYEDGGPAHLLRYDTRRDYAELKGTYFLGNHVVKAGLSYDTTSNDSVETFGGHQWRSFYDDSVQILSFYTQSTARTENTSFFLQDSWQVTPRLTVNAGLRYDQQVLYGAPGRVLKLGSLSDPSNGWAPRLGVVFDPSGKGTSKLFASYGRFHELMPIYINAIDFGNMVQKAYGLGYGPDNIPFTADDPAPVVYVDLDTSKTPAGVDSGLKPQYLDEVIVGGEWNFAPHLTAGLKGTYRTLGHVIEDMVGPEGVFVGTPSQGMATAWPQATRTFEGLELSVSRAFADRYQFLVSYLLSRQRGNYEGYYVTNWPQVSPNASVQFDFPEFTVNADGRLYDDRPHRLKASGAYVFDFGMTVGTLFSLQSGRPIHALGWDAANGYGNGMIFLSPRGSEGRTPTTWKLDLHVEQRFEPLRGLQTAAILDVFNVTNQNAVVEVDDNKYTMEFDDPANPYTIQNPYWKTPTRYQRPRLIRLGLKVSW